MTYADVGLEMLVMFTFLLLLDVIVLLLCDCIGVGFFGILIFTSIMNGLATPGSSSFLVMLLDSFGCLLISLLIILRVYYLYALFSIGDDGNCSRCRRV